MGKIDHLDERLIELLHEDARQTSEKLGGQLSISAATARRRLRRLLRIGALRIIAVPASHGSPVMAVVALQVDLDRSGEILRALSQKPQCRTVSTTTGRFDILAFASFPSTDDLSDFIHQEIAKVHGVRHAETFICLRIHKGSYVWQATSDIDRVDERLIELLKQDARQSSETLATRLSISADTVRSRLRRLLRIGALRIVALPNPYEIGLPVVAVIALQVDLDKTDEILRALGQKPRCRWVATTTGRFDILAIAWFRSTDDLSGFIEKAIAKVRGVRHAETFIWLHVEKTPWTAPLRLDRQG